MQLCGKCGHYNSPENIFCSHCANRLNNNCPACGYANLMQQSFCGSCGKQLFQQEVAPVPPHIGVSSPANGTVAKEANFSVTPKNSVSSEPPAAPALNPLETYALASFEFHDWPALLAQASDPALWEQARAHAFQTIVQQVEAAGGHINASKNQVLFVSFKWESTPEASVDKAIWTAVALLRKPFNFQGKLLPLRIGLDLEFSKARNPLTSTLERMHGKPQTLTVSERLFSMVGDQYPLAPLPLVHLGNRAFQFYQLRVATPSTAVESPGEQSIASAATAPQATASPFPHARPQVNPLPPPPTQAVQPPLQAVQPHSMPLSPQQPIYSESAVPVQQTIAQPSLSSENYPRPEAQRSSITSSNPAASQMSASAYASDSNPDQAEGARPLPPLYEPPEFGSYRAPRTSNLSYEAGIQALSNELGAFLARDPNAGPAGKLLSLSAWDGMGKSSIVHLARLQVDPNSQTALWMGGTNYRGLSRAHMPFVAWIELIANTLNLPFEGLAHKDAQQVLNEFLTFVYGAMPNTEIVSFWQTFLLVRQPEPLGVDSSQRLGRVNQFLFDLLKTLSLKRPLVLVLDDLHFADAASLSLFNSLIEVGLLRLPIAVVLTHTPDFYVNGPLEDAFKQVSYKELVISPMDDLAIAKFLDDGPLGGRFSSLPGWVAEPLMRQSQGIPLYLEEALRLFHLHGVLSIDPDTGKFLPNPEVSGLSNPLPTNLSEVIYERLEFLDEQGLYVLQMASVLGEKFAIGMLMALTQLEEANFNTVVGGLFNHGFLTPDGAHTGRFRHGLIWETVYETIDDALRLQMHQLAGEALENDFQQGITVMPFLLAYHSHQGQMPNRAVNYWNLAGVYYGQIGLLEGLNTALFQGLSQIEALETQTEPPPELALRMMETAGVFNINPNPVLATHMLEWVFYYRRQEGNALKMLEPLGFLAYAYEHQGDFLKALTTLEKSIDLIDGQRSPLELASLQVQRLAYLVTLGRLQQARELMEKTIQPVLKDLESGNAQFLAAAARARLLMGRVYLEQCHSKEAEAQLSVGLQRAHERQETTLILSFQLLMAQLHLQQGNYERCNQEADVLLTAIESLPQPEWFLAQWGLLAIRYHCDLEDWESASHLVLTVMSKAEAVNDLDARISAQLYGGYIAGKKGKQLEANMMLERAIVQSSDSRFASAALLGWRLLADSELAIQNYQSAYEIATRAIAVAEKPEIQNRYERIRLTLIAAQALLYMEQSKPAGQLLEPLWPQVSQTGLRPLIAECAQTIGMLYKNLAHNAVADLSGRYLSYSVEFYMKAKVIWLDLGHLRQVKKVEADMPKA